MSSFEVQGAQVAGKITKVLIAVSDGYGNLIINEDDSPQGYTIEYAKVESGVGMPGSNDMVIEF